MKFLLLSLTLFWLSAIYATAAPLTPTEQTMVDTIDARDAEAREFLT